MHPLMTQACIEDIGEIEPIDELADYLQSQSEKVADCDLNIYTRYIRILEDYRSKQNDQ